MTPELQLLLHNIGSIVSIVCLLALFIFIVVTNRQKKIANTTIAIGVFFILVFYVSHLFGVNTHDSELSRWILMSNVCIIFITAFLNHSVLAVLGLDKKRQSIIMGVYIFGAALAIFYLVFPDTFLYVSEPKLYFPNYYVAGSLHWVMRVVFNNIVPLYFFIESIIAYRNSQDQIFRNRIRWLLTGLLLGYVTGFIPVLLVFGIPVDPLWGIMFGILFVAPVAYAIIRYELWDIKIIARKALVYGVFTVTIGAFIIFLNALNQWLQFSFPGFPYWLTPLFSSALVVTAGVIIWNKMREGDMLKNEFVTTATHKFRTPLTHIKWATENLAKAETAEEQRLQLQYIQSANAKLVELTNVLMNISDTEDNTYIYHLNRHDLSELVKHVRIALTKPIELKRIKITEDLPALMFVKCDPARIRFVIQTFIENAVNYSSEQGMLSLRVYRDGRHVVLAVKDSGIGIPKDELPFLFSKFYRGARARLTDTEGMGIGLFISKEIIHRHRGKIWAESPEAGKGSTFLFSLPAAK